MTISSTTSKSGPYPCNGSTVSFAYGFKIADASHIKVILTNAAGVETVLVLGAHYAVSGVGNPSGGSVVLSTVYPVGNSITLLINVPFLQSLDLENQGAYNADDVEKSLDLSVQRDLQLSEAIGRAIKVPASSTQTPDQLLAAIFGAQTASAISAAAAAASEASALGYKDLALGYSTSASGYSASASGFSNLAQSWANQATGEVVTGQGYSSKYWSGISQAWSNQASGEVITGQGFSAKFWAGLAQMWSNQATGEVVAGQGYSAKYWSGLSQSWATQASGEVIAGQGYSAKYYALQAQAIVNGQVPAYTIKANLTNASATPTDATVSQIKALLSISSVSDTVFAKALRFDVAQTLSVTEAAQAKANMMIRFTTGQSLPGADIGPIWHDDYGGWMTWQVFNANGATYTGYASVDIGKLELDTQSTPRTGYVASGVTNLSKTAYAALYNWGKHNGRFVALASWVAGPLLMADNADGTTFRIFDVRGEFLRAWDNGRGADSGRSFGTWQDSDNKSHTHSINDPTHTHGIDYNANGVAPGGYGYSHIGGGWGYLYSLTSNATGIGIYSTGGAEARPRNTALLATVKF